MTNLSAGTQPVALLAIGTALPQSVSQSSMALLNSDTASSNDQQAAWVKRVFSRSGIDARGSVLQKDLLADRTGGLREFYPQPLAPGDRGPGTSQRMERYATEAPPLAATASLDALTQAHVPASRVTHLITVSCTGFFAPGLDVHLMMRLGLRTDVHRLHVGFMGCHAALNALGMARSIVLGDLTAIVLVCCVELCTLHFAYGFDPQSIVANSLFADGAAAAVIASGPANGKPPAWRLLHTASQLLPDSLDAMTWTIGDNGFEMTLSPQLPSLVQQHVGPWCDRWMGDAGRDVSQIANWAVHPGGPKILSAVETALGLKETDLQFSRQILAQSGNMSSTTVLFILQAITDSQKTGPCAALAFGPGLMMEGALLER
jgi:predicted naringenin-chalcone synthase